MCTQQRSRLVSWIKFKTDSETCSDHRAGCRRTATSRVRTSFSMPLRLSATSHRRHLVLRSSLDLGACLLPHGRSERTARESRSLVCRNIADGVAAVRAAHLHTWTGLAVAQRTWWVTTHELVHLCPFTGQIVEPDHRIRAHAPVLHTCTAAHHTSAIRTFAQYPGSLNNASL